MSLIKWNPFLGDNYFDDVDKIMSDFTPIVRGTNGFMPAIDMYEDKNNVIIETQLTGIDPEKIDISIENDVLYIKGEGEKKTEVEEKNYYRKEIRVVVFLSFYSLPTKVLEDQASAVLMGNFKKFLYQTGFRKLKPKPIK
jgi:HSP20 family protein